MSFGAQTTLRTASSGFECGFGDLEEQCVLAGDSFKVGDQLALNLYFGTMRHLMDRVDEQIAECVDQLSGPHMTESRQQGETKRWRMAPKLVNLLDSHHAAITLNYLSRELIEQVRRQSYSSQSVKFAKLFFQRLNAGRARISTKFMQRDTPALRLAGEQQGV